MIKLVVFDLDGTLAPVGKGMTPSDIELLKEIENAGTRIAVCSGKPCYYLCGFMRQIGLVSPILVGENGGEISFGVDLPPMIDEYLPYSDLAKESIKYLKEGFDRLIDDIWYQPNNVGLTPFLKRAEDFEIIEDFISQSGDKIKDLVVYRHFDCFDIMPKGIDKGRGVAHLAEMLGIDRSEVLVVGDGINDYPMFDYAGRSVGISVKDGDRVDVNFNSISHALVYILGEVDKND